MSDNWNQEEWWSTYLPILDENGNEADLGPPESVYQNANGEWVEYIPQGDESEGVPGSGAGGEFLYLLLPALLLLIPIGAVIAFHRMRPEILEWWRMLLNG